MKKLLSTTAAALVIGTSAFADAHVGVQDQMAYEASDLMGKRLYAGNPTDMRDNWEDIGEIDDLMVTLDGNVPAVIIGVGGFLGLGEKDVAVSLDQIRSVTDENGDSFLVVEVSAEQLEAMPAYDPDTFQQAEVTTDTMPSDDMTAEEQEVASTEMSVDENATDPDAEAAAPATIAAADTATETPAEGMTADAPATDMAASDTTDAQTQREGLMARDLAEIDQTELEGLTVYSANDENVGEISELIVGSDGTLQEFIVDVGGFIGVGEKPVALAASELSFMTDENGENLRAYTQQTEEMLEDMPAYEQ